ncbi:MAG: HTH marR-type domain-containing protein [Oscillospiraceae bacterium]|jgi:DNA-binding MarR family transcriptional regulator
MFDKFALIPEHIKALSPTSHIVIAWKLRHCNMIMRSIIEKKVARTGLFNSQHRLLMILFHHPNISQVEISRLLEISPAAVAVSLKKLEKTGCIKRTVAKNDNRTHQIVLTEKGHNIVKMSQKLFGEAESAMLKGFTEEEKTILTDFLSRIRVNLLEYSKQMEE